MASAKALTRFLAAWDDNVDAARIPNLAGFRKKVGDSVEYFVTAEAWSEVAAALTRSASRQH
jgi:hypothetical protein